MMGMGHAFLGTATWTAGVTYVFPALGWDTNPAILALGALPVAGAALIPDIDHPNASIAQSGGLITKGIARGASALSGGHREGTHRLWFFLLVAALNFGTFAAIGKPGALVWFFVMTAFGSQALAKSFLFQKMNRKWRQNTGLFAKLWCWAFAAVATVGAYYAFPEEKMWWWLPIGVTVGHATHLIGDSLTTARWEWRQNHRIGVPLLGDAGSERETLLTWVLAVVTLLFIGASFLGSNPGEVLSSLFGSLHLR